MISCLPDQIDDVGMPAAALPGLRPRVRNWTRGVSSKVVAAETADFALIA
jgi:hypothetical protein